MTQDPHNLTPEPVKNFPVTTGEVARMLGIPVAGEDLPMGTFQAASPHNLSVKELPVAPLSHKIEALHETPVASASMDAGHGAQPDTHHSAPATASPYLKVLKAVGPYVAVFTVGLFLYYFFFTGVNFSGMLANNTPKPVTPKTAVLSKLEASNSAAFQAWISSYYYDIKDPKIIDPEADNSGNGLSNFQKYLLGLNPKAYDTLGLGMADSQALANGIDPLSGGSLTDDEKNILSKYIDMEVVMNRLALANMQNSGRVAGATTNPNTISTTSNSLLAPASGGNYYNPSTGFGAPSNINSGNSVHTQAVAPVTGADLTANTDINTNIPGRLEIPSLKINVPIIWTKNTNDFDKDLQSGVVHYPGTAMPGQIGTTYIAGHSSNYIWAKGGYNQIFSTLGELAVDTSFKITIVNQAGQNEIFHYVVTGSKQYSPTDQSQFKNGGSSIVALSTCWPVDTTQKRLVVFGQLTQTENVQVASANQNTVSNTLSNKP